MREQRKARGWSQGKLAALLDVDQNTISRWETGKIKYFSEGRIRLAFKVEALDGQVKALTKAAKR